MDNVPDRIAALEHDDRGYPVPYIVLHDSDGKPHFTANDLLRVKKAINEQLCHICGQALEELIWFTGGPGSALLNGNAAFYADGPMHHDCMQYAMQVCPHLSHHMTKSVGETLIKKLNEQGIYTQNTTTIPGVPKIFVSVQTLRYQIEWLAIPAPTPRFVVPKPFRKTEYWQHGVLLPRHEGEKIAKRAARELKESFRKG